MVDFDGNGCGALPLRAVPHLFLAGIGRHRRPSVQHGHLGPHGAHEPPHDVREAPERGARGKKYRTMSLLATTRDFYPPHSIYLSQIKSGFKITLGSLHKMTRINGLVYMRLNIIRIRHTLHTSICYVEHRVEIQQPEENNDELGWDCGMTREKKTNDINTATDMRTGVESTAVKKSVSSFFCRLKWEEQADTNTGCDRFPTCAFWYIQ